MEQVEPGQFRSAQGQPHLVAERGHLAHGNDDLAPVENTLVHHDAGHLLRGVMQDEATHRAHSLAGTVHHACPERNEHVRLPVSRGAPIVIVRPAPFNGRPRTLTRFAPALHLPHPGRSREAGVVARALTRRAAGFYHPRAHDCPRADRGPRRRLRGGRLPRVADRARRGRGHRAPAHPRLRRRYPLRHRGLAGVRHRHLLGGRRGLRQGRLLQHPGRHVPRGRHHPRRRGRRLAGHRSCRSQSPPWCSAWCCWSRPTCRPQDGR